MYSGLPARERRQIKTALTASWVTSAGAGVSAFVLAPTIVVHELGGWGTIATGISLAVAALVAGLGVATAHYRWEWVSAWVSAAALAPYLVILWSQIIVGASDNSTQAFLATSLLGFYITRAFLCSAHAAKLREAHVVGTAVIDSMTDEGETDGDGAPGVK